MFRISALPQGEFEELFSLTDEALSTRGVKRYVANMKPGFPCRVSLEDAEPGERVILVPFCHQPASSPYRASGPIFVREGAVTAVVPPDTVPPVLRSRLLSIRAYDDNGLMVEADVVDGGDIESCLRRTFEHASVAYAHIHFARPGCYACRVDRYATL